MRLCKFVFAQLLPAGGSVAHGTGRGPGGGVDGDGREGDAGVRRARNGRCTSTLPCTLADVLLQGLLGTLLMS